MQILKTLTAACTMLLAWCSPAAAQNWQGICNNADGSVSILFSDTIDNTLYAVGGFSYIDGKYVRGIAMWDNTNWDSLRGGNTSGNNIYAITKFNNEIFVGGGFDQIDTIPCKQLARWNGTNWDSLPIQPFNGPLGSATISTFMAYNNELYIGGIFDNVAGIPANSLAKWNGSSWSDVYSFPNFGNPNYVFSMAVYNGELFVGGNFQGSNGMQDIARWDGTQWRDVGGGLKGGFADVRKMVVYNGNLYVGGSISMSDGNAGNSIMKWDGNNWSDVGGGIGGFSFSWVDDMVVYNSELYVTGVFSEAGGVPADRIAKWDGTNWCSLGSTFPANILTIAVHNDTLVIGGAFSSIDTTSVSHIGQWTGGNYVDTCGNTTGLNEQEDSLYEILIYPNPFNISTTFEITGFHGTFSISLYDQLGRIVNKAKDIEENRYELSREGLSNGMYFYTIQNKYGRIASGKLIIQ